MKKLLAFLLTLAMLFCVPGLCAFAEAPEEDDENYETGDAALDNPRNQDGIGEKELLVVSFGTSYNDSRRLTVGGIEGALEAAFPDWSVRRGFTSQIIIDHVRSRDGELIDNVEEALDRAIENGVKTLVVQPTHLMDGFEYNDLADALADGETAICFMGHGTEAESNAVYAKMQQVLQDKGCTNVFIGTVEATPSVEDVLGMVQAGSYKRVVLEPLMIVAGDHANNDMAGDEEDSWKSVFAGAGYEVLCVLRGLGEMEAIQTLFVEHARAAIDTLK